MVGFSVVSFAGDHAAALGRRLGARPDPRCGDHEKSVTGKGYCNTDVDSSP